MGFVLYVRVEGGKHESYSEFTVADVEYVVEMHAEKEEEEVAEELDFVCVKEFKHTIKKLPILQHNKYNNLRKPKHSDNNKNKGQNKFPNIKQRFHLCTILTQLI